jgi:hypothetical protein
LPDGAALGDGASAAADARCRRVVVVVVVVHVVEGILSLDLAFANRCGQNTVGLDWSDHAEAQVTKESSSSTRGALGRALMVISLEKWMDVVSWKILNHRDGV